MYIEFTKDYLGYPKGRVCVITEVAGESLVGQKQVAKKVDKKVFDEFEKTRIENERKCAECIEKGKECKECSEGEDEPLNK